ncbi:MAG: STAS domain-containing protein [Lachnospiraceae bacterium]
MISIEKNIMIIRLPEEIDHYHIAELTDQIDLAIVEHEVNRIIFDFEKTRFMDSSGIGLLLGRERKIRYYGGDVRIKNAYARIDTMIRMSGVEKIIKRDGC